MSEAGVHFELYRHLENAIDENPTRGDRTYSTVTPEYTGEISGRADLVLFDSTDDPVLVIEAKRPSSEKSGREIDPYAPTVIRQAHDYASQLGSPYFATYNGDRLVLFRTFEEGNQLLQRSTKSYEIASVEKFAGTLLDEIARLEEGNSQWDSLDDAFVQRIRSLHEIVTPEIETALIQKLEVDDDFRSSFVSWADTQGFDYENAAASDQQEIHENFAEQAAYLLINKVLFYKILEKSDAYGSDVRPLAVSIYRVQEDLEDHFSELVKNVDFEAIFEHDEIYSEIPLENIGERIREFVMELDTQNLTEFDSDVVGRIYEGVIPADRRHELGEYYTPPAITDLITEIVISDGEDRVMDPACGSGGFLVSAYRRKRELLSGEMLSHENILDSVYGIDINRFPAHLSAINLAIQDLSSYTESVNIEVSDFFEITPDTMRFGGKEVATTEGGDSDSGMIEETVGGFDAIIGNPPYIRQENIADKSQVRRHLKTVGGEHLSKRSDIYAYFITHATEFLKEDGRLGFIISDRWLDTSYGADLQDFILENFCVDAVIKFDKQAFEDALVGATVIILSRNPEKQQRMENVSKFLRVWSGMDVGEIRSVIEDTVDPNKLVRTSRYRLTTRNQSELMNEEKWNTFFLAPPMYFDLLASERVSELSKFGSVRRGVTSGANKFYYKRSEDWEELGLQEFTSPLLKASGQIKKIRFDEGVAGEWGWLNIHELVSEALEEAESRYEDTDEEEFAKQWLKNEGYESLVEYINWGEDQGYHDRPTTSARRIWFDLGDLEQPPMFMTDFTWKEHRVVWNDAGGVGTTQFYDIRTDAGVDEKTVAGILNSRLTWLMCELRGRRAGGEGMTRSRIKVYEAEELPVLDPRELDEEEKTEIRTAFESLMDREDKLGEESSVETTEMERDELDRAILSVLDMEDRLEELKQSVRRLVAMREEESGESTEVLVERGEDREVIELAGVSEARESTTLGDFQ